jgi:hypothetical protein
MQNKRSVQRVWGKAKYGGRIFNRLVFFGGSDERKEKIICSVCVAGNKY